MEKYTGVSLPSVCLNADQYKQVALRVNTQVYTNLGRVCVYVGTHVLICVYVYSCCGCQVRAKVPTLPVKNQLEHIL